MSNTPRERPQLASPAAVLGRLTGLVLAYAAAGAIVGASLPTILTPLPVKRLLPPEPPVVARTPVRMERQP
jgi:hypothetical protein